MRSRSLILHFLHLVGKSRRSATRGPHGGFNGLVDIALHVPDSAGTMDALPQTSMIYGGDLPGAGLPHLGDRDCLLNRPAIFRNDDDAALFAMLLGASGDCRVGGLIAVSWRVGAADDIPAFSERVNIAII